MKDGFLEINNDNDGIQFIMFPHLGGNGFSLMNLAKEFAQQGLNVWVAYPPGHLGSKGGLCNSYNELMDFYLKNIKNILKKNSIFFGHSMGGVIAIFLQNKSKKIYQKKT